MLNHANNGEHLPCWCPTLLKLEKNSSENLSLSKSAVLLLPTRPHPTPPKTP